MAAWAWARTIELSIIKYSLSRSRASSAKMRSHTPARAQQAKRLCTVLSLP
jgi:hypothetical protein